MYQIFLVALYITHVCPCYINDTYITIYADTLGKEVVGNSAWKNYQIQIKYFFYKIFHFSA